jgi:hypothetical protein
MRTTHTNRGWIETDDGAFLGVSLGFASCDEHEIGARELIRTLGVDATRPGFEAFCVTRPPVALHWEERKVRKPLPVKNRWQQKSVDPDKLNEALLYVGANTFANPGLFRWGPHRLGDMTDLRSNHYEPEQEDMKAGWNGHEALIWVRGTANIQRLRDVRDALTRADAVLNIPLDRGFNRRDGGLSLGIASRFPTAFKQRLLDDQRARQRLEEAVQATGVRAWLADHQRPFYALSPEWMDPKTEREVVFFLNPCDQRVYRSGWFTVPELHEWAQGRGPVFRDPALEAAERGTETTPAVFWQIRQAFQAAVGQEVGLRHLRVCWMDAAHTRMGVEVWPANQGAKGWFITPGVHDLADLLADPQTHAQWYGPTPENTAALAPPPVRARRRP